MSGRSPKGRQRGFALLVVSVSIAIMAAVVGEFGYNARVELEAAANARDQLRAEYLARSGIQLGRLLIKVQQSVLDTFNRQFKMDIQIGDFAPLFMKAFGGADGASDLASLLGIDAGSIKGLGVGKGQSFDVEMVAEDGKINVNCAGGLNAAGGGTMLPPPPSPTTGRTLTTITNPAQGLYALLTALMYPTRYNRLFERPDADGQYPVRDQVARAIIDWSDVDETRFEESGASGNSEDYRYDSLRDPYRPHNNYLDTVEELALVQGVTDDWWGAFGEMLTVYGRCKVNLNAVRPSAWPILVAILRATAKDRQNPVLFDEVQLAAVAQQIGSIAQLVGGLRDTNQFVDAAKNGGLPIPPDLAKALGSGAGNMPTQMQGLMPIELDLQSLNQLATTGPREVYRLDATGTVERGSKRVETHIRAVFDTKHFNQNTTSGDANDRVGTWVYWKMD